MKLSPEQQCLDNIKAWLKWTGLDYQANPVRVLPDRVFWTKEPKIAGHIEELVARKILLPAPSAYKGDDVIRGWREDVGSCSAQVIEREDLFEFDFDYFNPTRDVVGIVGHAVEVLQNKFGKRLTDQEKVARLLKKRGVYAI